MPRHLKKGDDVVIRSGDFKGCTGTVVRLLLKRDRVVVKGPQIEGVNKTLKPTRLNPQGGQVTIDRSFHISSVSPVSEGKPTRVRFQTKADGSKVRIAAKTGKELSTLRSPARAKKKKKATAKA
jgi:large subunit ribosomal protein L24